MKTYQKCEKEQKVIFNTGQVHDAKTKAKISLIMFSHNTTCTVPCTMCNGYNVQQKVLCLHIQILYCATLSTIYNVHVQGTNN